MQDKILVGFLFFLIILLVILGDYIHVLKTQRDIDYLNTHSRISKSKLTILIEVDRNSLSLIDRENEQVIRKYPIASGKPKSPTPLGSFKIREKESWGEGFGSRWIGLNVPWGKYGIHGTNQPGSIGGNVSAGCIRMRNNDVEDLFDLISKNTNVLITKGNYGPFGSGFRILKPGDRGADVLEVQKRLKQKKFYSGELDGIYGEDMKRSLINFLKKKKIELTDQITEDIYKELGIILME